MEQGPVVSIHDVAFRWPGKQPFALRIPKFSIARGEAVLLLGDSGSGKSTLLSLICGTILPQNGVVEVNGKDITKLSGGTRDRYRAENIGVVFQQFNLLPFGTVKDNILLPLYFARARKARCPNGPKEAVRLCHALGLPQGIEHRKAAELSVGQQQRVAVARALIGAPPLLIADEPTSALDEGHRRQFLDLMFAQLREQNASLLMVSHDPRLSEHFDRTLKIQDVIDTERQAA